MSKPVNSCLLLKKMELQNTNLKKKKRAMFKQNQYLYSVNVDNALISVTFNSFQSICFVLGNKIVSSWGALIDYPSFFLLDLGVQILSQQH